MNKKHIHTLLSWRISSEMWSLASHFTPLYFSTMVLWERKGTENIVMQTQKGPLGGRREYIYLSIYLWYYINIYWYPKVYASFGFVSLAFNRKINPNLIKCCNVCTAVEREMQSQDVVCWWRSSDFAFCAWEFIWTLLLGMKYMRRQALLLHGSLTHSIMVLFKERFCTSRLQ